MACSTVTCQSGCYSDVNSVDDDGRKERPMEVNGDGSNHASPRRGGVNAPGVCLKCKMNETIAVTHPGVANGGGEGGRFCADCFRSNLFGKFRFAVTSNAMISPSDNVLLAFSGGSASRYFCCMCVCVVLWMFSDFWAEIPRLIIVWSLLLYCIAFD